MKLLTRILSYTLIVVNILYILAVLLAPAIIDKKFNTSILLPPYHVSDQEQSIYNQLPFIADLHCDAVL